MKNKFPRIVIGTVAVLGLVSLFLFQRTDFAFILFKVTDRSVGFFINRTIRFLLNDALGILLIYALFYERKFVLFAIIIQVAGFFLLLLPYFVLKIYWPRYNGPMINFLHRIILNPTLLYLLIPAFYYQKMKAGKNNVD